MTMTSINIKYQLVPPGNYIENNAEKAIKTFKNYFIARMFSVEKDFHLQLWYRISHQETIRLNMIRQ